MYYPASYSHGAPPSHLYHSVDPAMVGTLAPVSPHYYIHPDQHGIVTGAHTPHFHQHAPTYPQQAPFPFVPLAPMAPVSTPAMATSVMQPVAPGIPSRTEDKTVLEANTE
jgi:hypothetical protein